MAGHTRATAFAPFVAYVVVFHLAWIAWPFVVYPRLTTLGDATLAYALLNISLRIQLWVAPVVLYLRQVDGIEPLEYLKLRHHVGRGIAVALVVTALNLAGSVARFGPPHPWTQALTWNSVLGTSFFVGFIEEIPYRGFMLQKFAERVGFWMATVLTSLLFVAIHVPGWIALHMLTIDRAASIFIFAVVMAIVFRYSRSLWAPIIAHSANDCMSFLLFHV
ncbi:MAG TPA: CPBP family intramembrane glutamic endopeptidase [Vicinamibacterales bacterium]|nr:CPBP family intramembrane glutamic endopeptidase [Vicinamibacterales bacterium]